jgi:hypothetical protein
MLHGCFTQPKVLNAWIQLAHTQISPPTLESSTKDLDLKKSGWGELKRLLKEYANGQEPATHERGGGVPFIGIWKN